MLDFFCLLFPCVEHDYGDDDTSVGGCRVTEASISLRGTCRGTSEGIVTKAQNL